MFRTYHNYNDLTTANLTLIPALIVMVVGVFFFILGAIGCCSACKENRCLLAVFFSLMLIVLTTLVMAGVLGYALRSNIRSAVNDGFKQAMDKYPAKDNETNSQKDQIDYLQREVKCCGAQNYSDWNSTRHPIPPKSCCINESRCNSSTPATSYYNMGCEASLEDMFVKNLKYVGGVAIAFAIIILLGMICSCILMCRTKEVRYELLGGPNSGLRV